MFPAGPGCKRGTGEPVAPAGPCWAAGRSLHLAGLPNFPSAAWGNRCSLGAGPRCGLPPAQRISGQSRSWAAVAAASTSRSRAPALLLCLLTAGPAKPRHCLPAPHLPGSKDEQPLCSYVSPQPSGWQVLGDRAAPRGLGEPLGFPVALVAVCVSGRARLTAASWQVQSIFCKRPAAAHVSTRQLPRSARFCRGKSRAELGAIGSHELPLLWHPATEDNTSLEVGQNWVTNHRSHICHPVPPSQKKGRGYIFQEVYPAAGAFGKQIGQSRAALTLHCWVPALPVPEPVALQRRLHGARPAPELAAGKPQSKCAFPVGGSVLEHDPKGSAGNSFPWFRAGRCPPGRVSFSWSWGAQTQFSAAVPLPFWAGGSQQWLAEVLRLAQRQAPSWETSLAPAPLRARAGLIQLGNCDPAGLQAGDGRPRHGGDRWT